MRIHGKRLQEARGWTQEVGITKSHFKRPTHNWRHPRSKAGPRNHSRRNQGWMLKSTEIFISFSSITATGLWCSVNSFEGCPIDRPKILGTRCPLAWKTCLMKLNRIAYSTIIWYLQFTWWDQFWYISLVNLCYVSGTNLKDGYKYG